MARAEPRPRVEIQVETGDPHLEAAAAGDAVMAVLRSEGVGDTDLEVTIIFTDPGEMALLNETHLGGTGPTDVLSFPLDGPEHAGPGPRLLGDVVICPQVAAAQAAEHRIALDDELRLLITHGVLHLLGHDHVTVEQRLEMAGRERAIAGRSHLS